jgi:hypothetical protein
MSRIPCAYMNEQRSGCQKTIHISWKSVTPTDIKNTILRLVVQSLKYSYVNFAPRYYVPVVLMHHCNTVSSSSTCKKKSLPCYFYWYGSFFMKITAKHRMLPRKQAPRPPIFSPRPWPSLVIALFETHF